MRRLIVNKKLIKAKEVSAEVQWLVEDEIYHSVFIFMGERHILWWQFEEDIRKPSVL